ncbi:unnamed protein product [Pieris macdunnoughi]|uniref:Zinc finger protein n=1 Tax=Pieris macdunnoughi TaxID=345717 RepID=A0A821RST6_9NEOP|nr:unnamed protein product [Pieris macdunnoughi]
MKPTRQIIEDASIKKCESFMKNYVTCRICAGYDEKFFSLNSYEDEINLGDMLTSIASVDIPVEEAILFNVCTECCNNIIFCYKFKMKCQKSLILLGDITNKETNAVEVENNSVLEEKKEIDSKTILMENNGLKVHNILNMNAEVLYGIEFLDDNVFEDEKCPKSVVKNRSKIQKTVKTKKQHIQDRVSKKFHSCKVCDKKFISAINLKSHMKIHSSEDRNLIGCKQCNEKFSSEHDLRVHSALHITANDKWRCYACSKEFFDRVSFRRHIRRHYKTKQFACEWCEKQFAELCALRRHERVHTGELRETPYECNLCDKRYSNNYLLKAHMMRHTGLRPCTCDVCGKSFPSMRLLNSHKLTHSDHKPYACPVCDKRFRHESTRKSHVLTHTGEKPYVCSVCGKTFRQNSNFTVHMRSHTGEKPYSCEMCPRHFKSTSSLSSHMSSHSKEKHFACTVCGKKFLRQSLSNHMRLHTGERSHACPACPKRFLSASRLKDHSKIHTDEKPFVCNICGSLFKKKVSLTNHLKKHDSKNNEKVRKSVKAKMLETAVDISEDMNLQITEVPLEVSEELVLQEDSNGKTELIVIKEEYAPQLLDGQLINCITLIQT